VPLIATAPRLPYAYPAGKERFAWAFVIGLAVVGTWVIATTRLSFHRLFEFGDSPLAAWCAAVVFWLMPLAGAVDTRSVRADLAGIDVWRSGTRLQVTWSAVARVSHTISALVIETRDGARCKVELLNAPSAANLYAWSTTPMAQLAADLELLRRTGGVDMSLPASAVQGRAGLPRAARVRLALIAVVLAGIATARTVGVIG
jgi:hypothetical protein